MSVVSDLLFLVEKNKQANSPVHFYDIYYTDSDVVRLTDCGSDLVFEGNTYLKFPIKHQDVSESVNGEVPKVKLLVGNADRIMQYYLELYDGLRGKRVDIITTFRPLITDDAFVIRDVFYVDTPKDSEEVVEFTLLPEFDMMSIQIPCRIYDRYHCGWDFKDSDCKYSGTELECDFSLERCEELLNSVNFGAFPSIPSQRISYSE